MYVRSEVWTHTSRKLNGSMQPRRWESTGAPYASCHLENPRFDPSPRCRIPASDRTARNGYCTKTESVLLTIRKTGFGRTTSKGASIAATRRLGAPGPEHQLLHHDDLLQQRTVGASHIEAPGVNLQVHLHGMSISHTVHAELVPALPSSSAMHGSINLLLLTLPFLN